MTITFGDQKIEVREWADGKALLITADPGVKKRILTAMDEAPDAFELLTDDATMEDLEGVLPVIVDRAAVGIFFDLEHMALGVCVSEEVQDEEEEAEYELP